MINSNLKIIGLDELSDDFKLLDKAMAKKVVRAATRAGARVAANKIKQQAPKRTGKLKKAIKTKNLKQNETPGGATSGVTLGDAFYGWFLEEGTVNMPAQPFARPAWDANINEIEGATKNKLAASIDNVLAGRR